MEAWARRSAFIISIVLIPFINTAFAQLWTGNSSNNRICNIDFGTGTCTQANSSEDQTARKSLQGFAIQKSDDGKLNMLACDSGGNGQLLFYGDIQSGDATATPIATVAGCTDVTTDLNGDALICSSPGGSAANQILRSVFDPAGCSATGGYCTPVPLPYPTFGPGETCEDILTVRSTAETLITGDVLVLTPTRVIQCTGSDCGVDFATAPAEDSWSGMTRALDGGLYIVSRNGTIRWYGPGGEFDTMPDIASNLGNGQFKTCFGILNDQNALVVTERNGGDVHLFGIPSTDPDDFDEPLTPSATVTAGVEFPVGCAMATGNAVPAFAGQPFTPCNVIDLTADGFRREGLTDCTVIKVPDMRIANPTVADCNNLDEPLNTSLDLSTLPGVSLYGSIPPYVRAQCINDIPTFVVARLTTTAEVEGTLLAIDEHPDFGHDAGLCPPLGYCATFWHPLANEAEILEGEFINITVENPSPRSRSRGSSQFVSPVADTRSRDVIVTQQLANLRIVLTEAGGAAPSQCDTGGTTGGLCELVTNSTTHQKLLGKLNKAIKFTGNNNWPKVIANVDGFIKLIEDKPTHFDDSTRNVSGELEARALGALFQACKLNPRRTPQACFNRLEDFVP